MTTPTPRAMERARAAIESLSKAPFTADAHVTEVVALAIDAAVEEAVKARDELLMKCHSMIECASQLCPEHDAWDDECSWNIDRKELLAAITAIRARGAS